MSRSVAGVLILVLSLGATIDAEEANVADPKEQIARSEDVEWLESVAASLERATELKPPGGLGRHAKDLRTAAYCRLGALGTPEALAAVRRIEEAAKVSKPTGESLGPLTHPAWHFADSTLNELLVASVEGENGVTYGIIRGSFLGGEDYYLISTATPADPATWSRPVWVQLWRSPRNNRMSYEEGDLRLELAYTIPMRQTLEDSDGDGWTNFEEQTIGLREDAADTDGDGIGDGEDVCPDYAPPGEDREDEEVQIIQRAFFATFGLTDSRYLLLVGSDSRKVQLWGYAGPVLYRDRESWKLSHERGGVFVDWEIRERTDTEAKVRIHDWEGPEAGGTQEVLLKKMDGEWFVVGRELLVVS